MFTEARRTPQNTWAVFCTDCGDELGTMTGASLSLAMLHGLTRGGVKCPKCRINCCPRCHYYAVDGALCSLCTLEVKEEKSLYNVAPV